MSANIVLKKPVSATRVALLAGCATRIGVGERVATVDILLADGRKIKRHLLYGLDLVGEGESKATTRSASSGGKSLVMIPLPAGSRAVSFEFTAAAPHTGLAVYGATLY
ncbi:MAG: hypothetical protein C4320_00740 [Armatimonadota bacterium]